MSQHPDRFTFFPDQKEQERLAHTTAADLAGVMYAQPNMIPRFIHELLAQNKAELAQEAVVLFQEMFNTGPEFTKELDTNILVAYLFMIMEHGVDNNTAWEFVQQAQALFGINTPSTSQG